MATKKREKDPTLERLIVKYGLEKGGLLGIEALHAQIPAFARWALSAEGERYAKRHAKRWGKRMRGFVSELPAMARDFARQEAHTPSSTKMVTLQSLAVDLSALTSSVNLWRRFDEAVARKLRVQSDEIQNLRRQVKALNRQLGGLESERDHEKELVGGGQDRTQGR